MRTCGVRSGLVLLLSLMAGVATADIPISQADLPLRITQPGNYHLSGNLSWTSPGAAITIINTNSVTVDLRGFAVSGSGFATGGFHAEESSNVSIINGSISGLEGGLGFLRCSGIFVQSINISGALRGMGILDSSDAIVSNCTISGGAWEGLFLEGTSNADIRHNNLSANAQGGILGIGCPHLLVRFNTITGSPYGVFIAHCGSHSEVPAIIWNTITGCSDYGIVLGGSVQRASVGNNSVQGSGRFGISAWGTVPIEGPGATNCHFHNNSVSGSGLFDLFDGNNSVGVNNWESTNSFITANIHPPVPVADIVATPPGTVVNGNVLANDADADVNPPPSLSALLTNGPANGSVTLSSDGSFTYSPTTGFVGTDSFAYVVSDGYKWNIATVAIRVNTAPVAESQTLTIDEDASTGVTLHASDADGHTLTYSVVSPSHGTLHGAPPNLSYTPNANYHGTDSFTYRVNDGLSDSSPATVHITVNPVNDAPTADSLTVDTLEDTPTNGAVSAGDVDGDTLTFQIVSDPRQGIATISASGFFNYAPTANSSGTDSFIVTVSDNRGGTATTTVTVNVNPINDAPTAANDTAEVAVGKALTVTDPALGVLANEYDVENDTLSAVLKSGPTNGTLVLSPNGTFTYTPNSGFSGTDSFSYVANDGQLDSNLATVTITVVAGASGDHKPVFTPGKPETVPPDRGR